MERSATRTLRPPRLSAFILAVLAWLPLTFAVWYFAAPLILWPSVLVMEGVARAAFPDLVRSVEQMGAMVSFATSLRPGTGGELVQVSAGRRHDGRSRMIKQPVGDDARLAGPLRRQDQRLILHPGQAPAAVLSPPQAD